MLNLDCNLDTVTIGIDDNLAKANGIYINDELVADIEREISAINKSSPFIKAVLHNQQGVLTITTQVKITDEFVDIAEPYFQVMTHSAENITSKVIKAQTEQLNTCSPDNAVKLINQTLALINKELIKMYPILKHMDTLADSKYVIREISATYTDETLSQKLTDVLAGWYWLSTIENAAVTLFTGTEQALLEMAETLKLGIIQPQTDGKEPTIVALADFCE